jgi:hypothetical protein
MTDEIIKPPLSLTEAGFEFERDAAGHIVPDNALQSARAELAQARIMSEQLAEAINKTAVDPSLSVSQRSLKSQKISATVAESIGRRLDNARNALTTELQRIETSADWNPRPATTARDITLESDVRQVLRTMTAEARLAALNSAIANNDSAVLSAAFAGPSLLISMPPEQRDALLQHWRKKHSPGFARYERLQEAAARVDQAGKSTVAWIKKLSAATNLEELATKAEAARASALKAASDAA